ncbi:MAG: cohesin domain-containing protein, partial [Anaerolineae bacterium]
MNRTTRTSLHIVTLLAMLGAIFGAYVSPVRAQDAVVKLSPSAASVNVGDTVVVNVTIENVSNLFGAEFHINFDTAYLEVVDADSGTEGVQIGLGDFLSPDFIATNTANNTTGVIDFGVAQMAPHGAVSGSGTLATITFRGKAGGTANVIFTSVLLSDPGGTEIPSSAQNGTVTVAGGAPTDTPTPTATATGPTPTPTATSTAPTATATVPAATKTPPSSCTIQGYHSVRAGETLYSIGRAYATRPSMIAACNGIVNPSKIYV